MERLYGDRLAEHEEILAYHFSRAGEWAKALAYFLKAAQKAAQACATHEAIALYDSAEEAARQLDAERFPCLHAADSPGQG